MPKPQEANDAEHNEQMLKDVLEEPSDDSVDPDKIEIEVDSAIDALNPDDDLETLRKGLKEAEDRLLRGQAELENLRRRSRREIEEERRFSNQPFLTDLLPVIDNVGRAIEAASQSPDASGLLEGFQMVAQQLIETLAKHHCSRIEAEGEPFDPSLHEAISQQPSDEHDSGTVVLVALPGYQLHDRVIRPAQVIVSTGPADT